MKRLGYLLTAILGLASATAQTPIAAQSGASGVTGAAQAIFPNGATFNGVGLRGLTLGQGVVIAQDGLATGQFQAVLLGSNSIVGALQDVVVEGEVQAGSFALGGSATVSGVATVSSGGTTLAGVPFVATVSTNTVTLVLNATPLPTATFTAGSITIE